MNWMRSFLSKKYTQSVTMVLVWSSVLLYCVSLGISRLAPSVGVATLVMLACMAYALFAWKVASRVDAPPRWKSHMRIVAGVVLALLLLGLLNIGFYWIFVRPH